MFHMFHAALSVASVVVLLHIAWKSGGWWLVAATVAFGLLGALIGGLA